MASKSLGTLTIDLIAKTGGFVQGMDKAERGSKKWRKQVEKDLNQVGKAAKIGLLAVSGAALAAGGALTAMAIKGLASVDSQSKFARSLDTSYDSITALNIAFSEGGVDNYEKSLNRLNRRLGAAEMGTGSAAKTVKALNLDLQALSDMDVDERVATISDAILDSGASAQLAARYVQDLGFEQKEATQFFLQGGDAIRGYRDQVDEFGLSVSDIDAVKIEQANDEFAKIGRLLDGVWTQVAVQVAPILSALSQVFVQNAKDAGGIGPAAEDGFSLLIDIAGFAADSVAGVGRVFKIVGVGIAIFGLSVKEVMTQVARDIIELPTAATNELLGALNALPYVDIDYLGMSDLGKKIDAEFQFTQGAIAIGYADIQSILMEPLPSTQFKKLVVDAKEAANDSAAAMIAAQKKIKDALGESGADSSGTESGSGESDTSADDAAKLEKDLANRMQAITQHFESEKHAILRSFGERDAEITALEETRTLSKMAADNLRYENEAEKTKALTAMYADNLIEREEADLSYWEKWLEAADRNLNDFDALSKTVIDNFTTGFGGAFESVIFDSESLNDAFKNMAQGMARAIVNSLGQMAAQWAVTHALKMAGIGVETAATVASEGTKTAAAVTGAAVATSASVAATATVTATQVAAAGTTAAAWLPAALVASIGSFGAAAVVGGAALVAAFALLSQFKEGGYTGDGGENEVVGVVHGKEFVVDADNTRRMGVDNLKQLTGMAHDGIDSVPQEGTWLLNKGERVVTAETSAKLDATLDRAAKGNGGGNMTVNINNAPPGTRTEESTDTQGNRVVDVFVADMGTGGPISRAMQSTYGLKRQGR